VTVLGVDVEIGFSYSCIGCPWALSSAERRFGEHVTLSWGYNKEKYELYEQFIWTSTGRYRDMYSHIESQDWVGQVPTGGRGWPYSFAV
jgi:hypothetical protein